MVRHLLPAAGRLPGIRDRPRSSTARSRSAPPSGAAQGLRLLEWHHAMKRPLFVELKADALRRRALIGSRPEPPGSLGPALDHAVGEARGPVRARRGHGAAGEGGRCRASAAAGRGRGLPAILRRGAASRETPTGRVARRSKREALAAIRLWRIEPPEPAHDRRAGDPPSRPAAPAHRPRGEPRAGRADAPRLDVATRDSGRPLFGREAIGRAPRSWRPR